MTNAPDWVSFYARRNGNAPALESVDNGKTMSWGQLEQRVSALSGVLVSRFSVKRGDRVSVIAENDFRVFELLFACMRIGAIFVPMNWRLTPTELSVLIEDCEPGLLLHDEIWAETARQLVRLADGEITLFGWDESGGEYEGAVAAAAPLAGNWTADVDDPTCILYTSGTTGIPKGALVTHRTMLAQVENAFVDCLLGLPGSRYLNPMPLFHAGGLTTLCLPVLASGGAVAFARRFDPGQCLDWLVDPAREITHFNGSPIFFEQLAGCSGFGRSGFSHLKHAHVAGATIMDSLIDQWADAGFLVQQFYGGTEMGPSAMAMPLSRVLDKRGSCGQPMLLTRSRLVDANMVDGTANLYTLLSALSAMGLAACATVSTPATTEQALLAADRAFAARALEIGAGPAFVEFAADDVTIFPSAGVPETGKAAVEAWTSQWPEEMIVEWAPEAAHAGKGGDFGYTWGYATYTREGQEGASYGKYITGWQRQEDGSWKWIADMGSGAPAPEDR